MCYLLPLLVLAWFSRCTPCWAGSPRGSWGTPAARPPSRGRLHTRPRTQPWIPYGPGSGCVSSKNLKRQLKRMAELSRSSCQLKGQSWDVLRRKPHVVRAQGVCLRKEFKEKVEKERQSSSRSSCQLKGQSWDVLGIVSMLFGAQGVCLRKIVKGQLERTTELSRPSCELKWQSWDVLRREPYVVWGSGCVSSKRI